MPASRQRQRQSMLHPKTVPSAPRAAITPAASSRGPAEWLAARLPLPLLLLALPLITAGMIGVGLYAGLRYRFWDTAFSLAVCSGTVWFFLAYLGIA